MMAQDSRRYILPQIIEILEKFTTSLPLPPATLATIESLAKLVGAPTYQRIPVFKRPDRSQQQHHRRPRPRIMISAADWEEIRNFKTTELAKNTEGLAGKINIIRSNLNKITESNYSEMRDNILKVLEDVLEADPPVEHLTKIGSFIFEIGSMNKFWSKLYAALYRDLIQTFSAMQAICQTNFVTFLALFDDIKQGDAEKDYDEFCRLNRVNAKRRAMSSFFISLMQHGVIAKKEMIKLILSLQERLYSLVVSADNKKEVEELAENLFILISGTKDKVDNDVYWDQISSFLRDMVVLDKARFPSLTNQALFKFMDLKDFLQ